MEGELVIRPRPDASIGFSGLLQRGLLIRGCGKKSLRDFLLDELGLSERYVDERVQTAFINGRAVDDFESAAVNAGDTVSLSAAMPGLLGATLRRGSYYARMRGEISYSGDEKSGRDENAPVLVKLFNLLAGELSMDFLSRGGWFRAADVKSFLDTRGEKFWSSIESVLFEGNPVKGDELGEKISSRDEIYLRCLK